MDIHDVFVRLRTDLLVLGDGIVTDRPLASNGNDAGDPQRRVGGIILPFQPSAWLRHGMARVVQQRGATVCHPGESSTQFGTRADDERDLDGGYHENGACARGQNVDDVCVVLDLFGGFGDHTGTFLRRPIRFSPVRSSVDFARGQAVGHYRRLDRNVLDGSRPDVREPLRNAKIDAVANLQACWHLSFRERNPEFLGLLADAIEFLDDHRTDFGHQLGGARNFGAGVVDCELVNPLYEEDELRRLFDRAKDGTAAMVEKDRQWADEHRPACVDALEERLERWP